MDRFCFSEYPVAGFWPDSQIYENFRKTERLYDHLNKTLKNVFKGMSHTVCVPPFSFSNTHKTFIQQIRLKIWIIQLRGELPNKFYRCDLLIRVQNMRFEYLTDLEIISMQSSRLRPYCWWFYSTSCLRHAKK